MAAPEPLCRSDGSAIGGSGACSRVKLVQNMVAAIGICARYQSEEAGKVRAIGGQNLKYRLGPIADEAIAVKTVHEGSFLVRTICGSHSSRHTRPPKALTKRKRP